MKTLLTLCFSFLFVGMSAQIYFQEDFEDCELPAGWSVESDASSKGWLVGDADQMGSEKLIFPKKQVSNCFAANNDELWDNENGDQNMAEEDMLITPFIDLSGTEHLILAFDYISAYGIGFKVKYRTEGQEWSSVNNVVPSGGVLEWQDLHTEIYGNVNAPIKNVSEPIQFMFQFSDFGVAKFLGVGLDNIVLYEGGESDLKLKNVHISDAVPVGLVPILPVFENHGSITQTSCKILWQLDDGPITEEIVSDFKLSSGNNFSFFIGFGVGVFPGSQIYIDVQETGEQLLKVWIELSDNFQDETPDNNYFEKKIHAKLNLPEKHYVYEKFSHNTCGPCYEADQLAEEIANTYDNILLVSVHNGSIDPMAYLEADIIDISYSQRTHPGTMMDRKFYDFGDHGRMSSLYDALPELTTPWWSPVNIEFTSKELLLDESKVKLSFDATFVADLEGDYRFNIFTLEDSIMAYQAQAPEGSSYIHNHVLRSYSGGNWGAENSIPASIKANTTYSYEAEIDIDPSWDLDQISFIGIVQKFEEDGDDRVLVNAKHLDIYDMIVLDDKKYEEININLYPNPASDDLVISLPSDELDNIRLKIYSQNGQLVLDNNYDNLSKSELRLSVKDFAEGTYFVRLFSDDHAVASQNLVIIH